VPVKEREVIYDESRWRVLREKRNIAKRLMTALRSYGFRSIVYGSIARGDVSTSSDVDVFILYQVPSYLVELAVTEAGFHIYGRLIVQATPHYAVKAYMTLDPEELVTVSFPLVKMTKRELEFYSFGGKLELNDLTSGRRVPGVDKRLMLIIPTKRGHLESSIIGREEEVASLLGISPEIVKERVTMLTRREEIGRTGVFIKYRLSSDESFESALKRLSNKNPLLRKLLRERSGEY